MKLVFRYVVVIWLVVIAVCSMRVSLATHYNIDSLNHELRGGAEDSNKVILYYNLTLAYFKIDPEEALNSAEKGLQLAQKVQYVNGEAQLYKMMGNIHNIQGNYSDAFENYLKAVQLYESLGKKRNVISCYNNMGVLHHKQQNYNKAQEYYELSLTAKEELGDTLGMIKTLNNLGVNYKAMEDTLKAEYYYNKSLILAQEIGNREEMAKAYNNLAIIYMDQKKPEKALQNLKLSLSVKEALNDKYDIANTLVNIGRVYTDIKEYSKALEYLERGLALSKQVGYKEIKREAYQYLSRLYAAKKNYDKAYSYELLHGEVRDSLLNEEKSKQFAEMETKYETAKKEQENARLAAENQKQAAENQKQVIVIFAIGIVLLFVLVLAMVIFRGYKEKQKANILLSEQKDEIVRQKDIIEEKNKDIMDSIKYAKRIQEALAPPDQLIAQTHESFFVYYKPKDIVSGDFYWFYTKDSKMYFAAVDCTGHGVPGAFMSIVGHNGLNSAVNEYHLDKPSLILDYLNEHVNKSLHKTATDDNVKDGMDIALCCIDISTMKLEFSGAYNPLYLVRKGELQDIKADRQAIGLYGNDSEDFNKYSNYEMNIERGDCIYISSDGFPDQFGGPKGKKFQYKRFRELLSAISEKEMLSQKEILDTTFQGWKGNLEQVDDICIIGMKVT